MTFTHCKTLLGTNTKLIKGMKIYYQPELYFDDGTNIGWSLPEELYSFQVFETYEDAYNWLIQHDYDPDDAHINEYHDDDIEEPTFIDEYGDEIEEDE